MISSSIDRSPVNVREAPEKIHPTLWLASQLARSSGRTIPSGFPVLDRHLPGGGWPVGSVNEILLSKNGVGEIRVVAGALKQVSHRKILLISPPHTPQILGLAALGLPPEDLIWVRPATTADALWSVETALKAGVGAVLFWCPHARNESLRRLHLAAEAGQALCLIYRPWATTPDASPAPLRLGLRAAVGGVDVTVVKRRGPQVDAPFFVALQQPISSPGMLSRPAGGPRVLAPEHVNDAPPVRLPAYYGSVE
jgi:protein ImuA